MRGNFYVLRNTSGVSERVFYKIRLEEITAYLKGVSKEVPYVKELPPNAYAQAVCVLIQNLLNPIMVGAKWAGSPNSKCFIEIPTTLFWYYTVSFSDVTTLGPCFGPNSNNRRETEISPQELVFRKKWNSNFIISESGMPESICSWAWREFNLANIEKKKVGKYEVMQVFEYHC